MLDHLMWIYRVYEDGNRSERWLAIEAGQWLSQYSVAADDIAFAMGCALQRYAMERVQPRGM